MGEDERRAGGVADFAGAGGDVVKGAPPAGEQGEPSFPEAAQGTLEGVAGAGIDVKFPAARRLLDGHQDADARALMAGVGNGGQAGRGGRAGRGQGMGAGGGDVVHRARFRLRDPQRGPVRGHRLDVAAVSVRLARVPQVDDLAADADGWFLAPVGWDDLPVQDQAREALVLGALQRLAQVRGLLCQDDDDFIEVAAGGGPRDAV
jgi:hypothetical protein